MNSAILNAGVTESLNREWYCLTHGERWDSFSSEEVIWKLTQLYKFLKNVGLSFINNVFLNKKGEVSKKEYLMSDESKQYKYSRSIMYDICVCKLLGNVCSPQPG